MPALKSRQITHMALFLALSILLPIAFHQFGLAARIFLPMHLPVLICGFFLGPFSGVVVGLLAPFLSQLLTGMPPAYAIPLMAVELPVYGLTAGLLYRKLGFNIYPALIISMIAGRAGFAIAIIIFGQLIELPYGLLEYFAAGGALVTGIPGIVVQLIVIPPVMTGLKRSQLTKFERV